ncbi:class I SAM-dependent methyltransferase [Salinicola peritrichatus]|uniref:class I SAM-dependent methyltransferase n=1 Tax=Salinicola peritrichatus TaxID=1267424 RepID=UPI000DA1F61F|nr:class I SAM-dependent methyltransferase [Salinicola peritrichatus]
MPDHNASFHTLIHLGCGEHPEIDTYAQLAEQIWLIDADGQAIDALQMALAERVNVHCCQALVATQEYLGTFYRYNLAWANGLTLIDEATQRIYPGLCYVESTRQPTTTVAALAAQCLSQCGAEASTAHMLLLDVGRQNHELLQALEDSGQLSRFSHVILLPAGGQAWYGEAGPIAIPPSLHGPAKVPAGLSLPERTRVLERHPLLQELQRYRASAQIQRQASDQLEQQLAEVRQQHDAQAQALAEIQRQFEECSRERDNQAARVGALVQERDTLQQQLEERTQERDTSAKARGETERALEQAQQAEQQTRQQLTELTRKHDEQVARVETLAQECDTVQQQLEERTQQRDGLWHKGETLTQERDTLQQQLEERTQQRDELCHKGEALTQERDELKHQVDELARQREDALHQNHLNHEALKEAHQISARLTEERDHLHQELQEAKSFIHKLSHRVPSGAEKPSDTPPPQDGFYRAFEDRFRGSREEIKRRVQVYLPFVAAVAERNPNVPVLDLGCGRGEWLEVLKQAGIAGEGIDQNAGMLEGCHELGLNVTQGDAITHLQQQSDASYICISLMHVVEHIPFDTLRLVVEQARRVLVPDGVLIMETPNPENVMVGSCNFYTDPTHRNPLPPPLLAFLPEYYGFERVKVLRLQELPALHDKLHYDINDFLTGVSPDYAVLAQAQHMTMDTPAGQQETTAWEAEYGISLHYMMQKNAQGVGESE